MAATSGPSRRTCGGKSTLFPTGRQPDSPCSHALPPLTLSARLGRLEGKFVVAYSGNLGRVHDLEARCWISPRRCATNPASRLSSSAAAPSVPVLRARSGQARPRVGFNFIPRNPAPNLRRLAGRSVMSTWSLCCPAASASFFPANSTAWRRSAGRSSFIGPPASRNRAVGHGGWLGPGLCARGDCRDG